MEAQDVYPILDYYHVIFYMSIVKILLIQSYKNPRLQIIRPFNIIVMAFRRKRKPSKNICVTKMVEFIYIIYIQ